MGRKFEIQVIDGGGLGEIVWTGEAREARHAVEQFAAARGHVLTASEWGEFVDVNRDGLRFDQANWTGETLSVEEVR